MSGNLVETLIGALVLVVAIGFLAMSYSRTDAGSVSGYALTAKFEKVDGITVGSDVMLGGIKVGSVVGQRLDPKTFLAVLDLSLSEAIMLPSDSAIKVASAGLLGDKYLSIDPGGDEETLKPGEEIRYTQGSVDLTDLIGKAIYSSQGSNSQ